AAPLVYAYLSDLDGTGHRVGVDSDAWREQLWFVDQLVARLRRAMPADSLLLVTGDHGMVDIARDRRVDLAELPELWPGIEAIAGEPRATTLRLVAGESAQQVAATWNARLGPDFLALPMTAAAELYGGLSATAARRAGDVLVLAVAEDVALIDSRHRSTKASWLHGMHGGLTDAERIVPLCLVTP
ncbi:MAG: alkaline phosphatase family protein, partial [Actinomycetales bacterium]